jgi:hypothetical protein
MDTNKERQKANKHLKGKRIEKFQGQYMKTKKKIGGY